LGVYRVKVTVKMPRVADSVDTVTVVEWEKSVGQIVATGETLLRVETDKAIVEVPSPIAGTVLALLVTSDADITTGTPIATIEAD
jgi:pyruvate/2-oxoglutarate dehydrogenase complex dihydrolipoamide acyltransferase (E2) component